MSEASDKSYEEVAKSFVHSITEVDRFFYDKNSNSAKRFARLRNAAGVGALVVEGLGIAAYVDAGMDAYALLLPSILSFGFWQSLRSYTSHRNPSRIKLMLMREWLYEYVKMHRCRPLHGL